MIVSHSRERGIQGGFNCPWRLPHQSGVGGESWVWTGFSQSGTTSAAKTCG